MVCKVKIYPRKDCCWNRYSDIRVYIMDMNGKESECQPTYGVNSLETDYVEDHVDSGIDFDCLGSGMTSGIFVTNQKAYIMISEIEAF